VRDNEGGFVEKGVCWIKRVLDCESVFAMALLFPSHIFCPVFIGVRTGCLNHKSPAIWLVTCSA